MPWHVAKSDRCPAAKPWAVIKDTDSSVVACHATKASAQAQMAALYANEPGASAAGQGHTVSRTPSTGKAGPMTDIVQQRRAERPPTVDLLRMAPFALRAAAVDGEPNDGLTLDGYAAVFNVDTLIDSWEGRFWERAAPGSMKKSFRENPPRVQFDHGRHPMVGSIPIASLSSAREEVDPELAPEGGAHVIARLFDNWLVQPVRDAIGEGAIDGMSFRFGVIAEQWTDPDGKIIRDEKALMDLLWRSWVEEWPEADLLHRTLREVRVPELGPVVWPQYTETSVSVRDRGKVVIDLSTLSTDPGQRRALAQAVLLADAAERQDREAPQPTEPPAGTHAEPSTESPQGTASSAAEHEPSPVGTRKIDVALRHMRARLLTIRDE